MAHLNQAALPFVQIVAVCHILTVVAIVTEGHRVMLVARGDSVMLTCNVSTKNASEISWTKGSSVFKYSTLLNRTFSNFSFHRLKINHELPSKLIIFSAQPEDEGLYICNITGRRGLNTISWNLTVSEILKETMSSNYFLYILLIAFGLLLCGIMFAIFLCRRSWTKTPNEDLYDHRTLSCVQYDVQLGGKAVPPQPPSFAVAMTGSTLKGSIQSVASSELIRRQSR